MEGVFGIRPVALQWTHFTADCTQKPSQVTDTLLQPLFALAAASPLGGNQAHESLTSRNTRHGFNTRPASPVFILMRFEHMAGNAVRTFTNLPCLKCCKRRE